MTDDDPGATSGDLATGDLVSPAKDAPVDSSEPLADHPFREPDGDHQGDQEYHGGRRGSISQRRGWSAGELKVETDRAALERINRLAREAAAAKALQEKKESRERERRESRDGKLESKSKEGKDKGDAGKAEKSSPYEVDESEDDKKSKKKKNKEDGCCLVQ
eukprot:Hpha_TRINITY_DN14360_c0_g1::TRINITY_DN14360_c0_g1_i1::g.87053::m.87053